MRASRVLPFLVAAGALSLGAAPAAQAAFPGSDGRIAFNQEAPAGDHTQTDIYTLKADGTALRQLSASANRNEFGPTYNAAGTQIAFWRTPAPFGPGSLWVMNADGTGKRQLTSGIDARDPAWNPEGTRLAYTGPGAGGDFFDLWTLRVSDGLDRKRVTSGAALDFEPAWSPGGTAIAFTRGSSTGDPGDIAIVDVTTGTVTPVTASPAYDHQVAWAPSGARLVFERDFVNSSSIFKVSPVGANLQRLTTGPFFDTGPSFSPRATRIAFGTDRGGLFPDLWLIGADGANPHPLIALQFAESFPDWQALPD